MARLDAHAAELRSARVPVVLARDYNVAPEAVDVYPTRSYDDNALVQPASRAAFRRLLDQGWVDALRRVRPEGSAFTFWDYRRNRWPRDAGLRLDHLLLSPDVADRLTATGSDREVRGAKKPSDHAPVWATLGA